MVPALLAPLAKGAASLIGWQGASAAGKRLIPKAKGLLNKAKNFVKGNPTAAAKGGGILGGLGIGGFTVSSVLSDLGIEDNQLQTIITLGGVVAAIAAVGQLFDIQLGGN